MRTIRKTAFLKLAAAAAASSMLAGHAIAASVTWDGGGTTNNWSDAVNWAADVAPVANDFATFDNSGVAKLANTVDASLSLGQLNYRQDAAANVYTTSIDRNATLTITGTGLAGLSNTTTTTNSSFVAMPTTDPATAGGPTGTNVVFQSTGTGAQGGLSITGFNVLVNGRSGTPGDFASYAIVDLRSLDSFSFAQPLPQGATVNTVFGIGTATASGDNGAVYGEVWLSNNSSIGSNRITVGGQHRGSNSATANLHGKQPVALLMLGQTTNLDTNGTSGNIYVGSDAAPAPARAGSGAMRFQAGLVNPVLTIGGGSAIEIARNRAQANEHCFGVLDLTSASGTVDGEINANISGLTMGYASAGTAEAGGGFGMFSFDKGTINGTTLTLASTNSAMSRGSTHVGTVNIGLKGADTDAGAGTYNVSGNVTVGRRAHASSGTIARGTLNLANAGVLSASRVFIGENNFAGGTGTDMPIGSVIGIVNLGGGTLETGQIQAGSDTAQAGLDTTRLINFNGGKVKVRTGTTFGANFMQGLTAANVYGGGATVDTNGESVTVNQALVAPVGSGVASVSVDAGGSGYRTAPIVIIKGGGGTGATGVARINAAGAVIGIDITNPGTGYTSAPTIELVANGGTAAAFGVSATAAASWGRYDNLLTPFGGVAATLTPVLGANSSGGFTKTGAGTLTLGGANTYPGATKADGGKLVLGKSLTTSSSVSSLNDATIELANVGTHNEVIKTGPVSIDAGARIDLKDNKLITTTAAGTATGGVYSGVQGDVQRASNFGAWDQPGLTTSEADAVAGLTTIGIATGEQIRGLGPTDTDTFAGQTITGASTVAMYTYAGDANLDGTIDGGDYGIIDNFAQIPGADGYANGDFNYDGVIDGGDYGIIDNNNQAQGAPFPTSGAVAGASLSGVTAVPEPASLSVLALGAAGLFGRRRRRSR